MMSRSRRRSRGKEDPGLPGLHPHDTAPPLSRHRVPQGLRGTRAVPRLSTGNDPPPVEGAETEPLLQRDADGEAVCVCVCVLCG